MSFGLIWSRDMICNVACESDWAVVAVQGPQQRHTSAAGPAALRRQPGTLPAATQLSVDQRIAAAAPKEASAAAAKGGAAAPLPRGKVGAPLAQKAVGPKAATAKHQVGPKPAANIKASSGGSEGRSRSNRDTIQTFNKTMLPSGMFCKLAPTNRCRSLNVCTFG